MESLPRVRDYMATKLRVLEPEMDILEAVDFLLRHRVSGAPVVERSTRRLVGILSEKDCLRLLAEGVGSEMPKGTVADFMTSEVKTLPPDMDIYYAAGLFLQNVYRRFPVVEEGRLVGQISRRDVLRAIQERLRP